MKKVLLKKIVIVVGKLTRSGVLRGRVGIRRAPNEGDGARKFSLSCRARRGWGNKKSCGLGAKTPSFGPTPPHCHP